MIPSSFEPDFACEFLAALLLGERSIRATNIVSAASARMLRNSDRA
jgi:hypothetical protein